MSLQTENFRGVFVAVVGPSGAGKDSIMRDAAKWFSNDPGVHFAKRIVTRQTNAFEDHDSVSDQEFSDLIDRGGLALHWEANGLRYGISSSVLNRLSQNHVVVANTSRAISARIKALFPVSVIIHVTASEQNLKNRLAARNRENSNEADLRLSRSNELEKKLGADIRIENNGELEDAVVQFISAIRALKPPARILKSNV